MIEHTAGPTNYLAYPTGDSHPSDAGHNRAAADFAPWVNAAYHAWKAGERLPAPGTPDVAPTSISIKTNATTARVGNIPILSGSVTPTGTIGENIVVYVMKPGKTYWTYSSNRTVYNRYGTAAWQYKYYFKPGMVRGVYKFKSVVPALSGSATATSPVTASIRLR